MRATLSRAVPPVAFRATATPIAPARAAEIGERTLDRGDDVRAPQELLTELDLDTATDGVFEEWTAPGWYAGGQAIDPRPSLRSLEA